MNTERKEHWDHVYKTKDANQMSWTQEIPKTSLDFIRTFNLAKDVSIIDVGGGDSRLADFLIEDGYTNVTVLDISSEAIEKAKKRMGELAKKVKWIVCDITKFNPDTTFDVWHDRAVFHFLTSEDHIDHYINTAKKAVNKYMVMGTFSSDGPKKCSGLDVRQYTEKSLTERFSEGFEKIKCFTEDHITPSQATQNFLFCSFKKR